MYQKGTATIDDLKDVNGKIEIHGKHATAIL